MSRKTASDVVEALSRSRKYAHLCEATLERMALWALARHPSPKDATKAAKRKLHQVYGAYVERLDLKHLEALVTSLPQCPSDAQLRATCADAMQLHASTAERLPLLDSLYGGLFALTGSPSTVLDIACGLNPFSLPWMGLGPDAKYVPLDIDQRLTALTNDFLGRLGRPALAECRDVLVSPPSVEADVALLLKTAPCLEQQEPGATARLLGDLKARHAVVSFPVQSLGGRDKGMRRHYESFMADLSASLGTEPRVLDLPGETYYVLPLT